MHSERRRRRWLLPLMATFLSFAHPGLGGKCGNYEVYTINVTTAHTNDSVLPFDILSPNAIEIPDNSGYLRVDSKYPLAAVLYFKTCDPTEIPHYTPLPSAGFARQGITILKGYKYLALLPKVGETHYIDPAHMLFWNVYLVMYENTLTPTSPVCGAATGCSLPYCMCLLERLAGQAKIIENPVCFSQWSLTKDGNLLATPLFEGTNCTTPTKKVVTLTPGGPSHTETFTKLWWWSDQIVIRVKAPPPSGPDVAWTELPMKVVASCTASDADDLPLSLDVALAASMGAPTPFVQQFQQRGRPVGMLGEFLWGPSGGTGRYCNRGEPEDWYFQFYPGVNCTNNSVKVVWTASPYTNVYKNSTTFHVNKQPGLAINSSNKAPTVVDYCPSFVTSGTGGMVGTMENLLLQVQSLPPGDASASNCTNTLLATPYQNITMDFGVDTTTISQELLPGGQVIDSVIWNKWGGEYPLYQSLKTTLPPGSGYGVGVSMRSNRANPTPAAMARASIMAHPIRGADAHGTVLIPASLKTAFPKGVVVTLAYAPLDTAAARYLDSPIALASLQKGVPCPGLYFHQPATMQAASNRTFISPLNGTQAFTTQGGVVWGGFYQAPAGAGGTDLVYPLMSDFARFPSPPTPMPSSPPPPPSGNGVGLGLGIGFGSGAFLMLAGFGYYYWKKSAKKAEFAEIE